MIEALEIIGVVVFVTVLLMGLLAILLGLPGTVIIFADAFIFSAVTRFEKIQWWMLIILAALSATAELADNVLGAAAAKKYGASTRSSLATIVGAVVGALVVSPLLGALATPIAPGIATAAASLVGALVGAFGGAFVAAYLHERHWEKKGQQEAVRAGWGAVAGRLLGVILKVVIATAMVILIVWQIWPS